MRFRSGFVFLCGVLLAMAITGIASGFAMAEDEFVIAIHGGGGVRPPEEMTPELDAAYREALRASLAAGHDVLKKGGHSVFAVEAAIRVMEDSPLFNAGRGSSYNRDGIIQMDASIMDGNTSDAGAAAVVQRVRHPITLARVIMEASPHVMMADVGALEFAKTQGLEIMPPHYFHTERKWDSLQRRLRQGTEYGTSPEKTASSSEGPDYAAFGTVGAVAMDIRGDLAAGTSTGGREGKLHGRIGDSPIIGAGTYANNATLAISSTGLGEYVIRVVGAKTMSDLMEYKGLELEPAIRAVMKKIHDMGGSISAVAVDANGRVAMPYSGNGMYRGYVREDGRYVIRIYSE
jgi:beta-aspartyl-peptidase (threonine type)